MKFLEKVWTQDEEQPSCHETHGFIGLRITDLLRYWKGSHWRVHYQWEHGTILTKSQCRDGKILRIFPLKHWRLHSYNTFVCTVTTLYNQGLLWQAYRRYKILQGLSVHVQTKRTFKRAQQHVTLQAWTTYSSSVFSSHIWMGPSNPGIQHAWVLNKRTGACTLLII